MVRNVAIDVDHLINCKIRTAAVVEHNTCLDFHQDWFDNHGSTQQVACAVVNLYVPNDNNAAGDGAYLGHNILHGNLPAPDDTVSPDPPAASPAWSAGPTATCPGNPAKTSVLQIVHNFIDPNLLDASLGANHPGASSTPPTASAMSPAIPASATRPPWISASPPIPPPAVPPPAASTTERPFPSGFTCSARPPPPPPPPP